MNAHRPSGHEHWSDDVLIGALYGLEGADLHARLGECPECAARWKHLQEKRAAIAVPLDVPAELLAAQRKAIYRRIEREVSLLSA